MPRPIPKDVKDQILSRVREGKETVIEIARQHGVKVNTVYGWVSDSSGVNRGAIEINRVKRENQKLKEIIGQLVFQTERGKKN